MSLNDSTDSNLKFTSEVKDIDINQIEPNEFNPREDETLKDLDDMITSIREMGILVPILVYKKSENKYVLLDGERRWRAFKILSKEDFIKYRTIKANVIEKPISKEKNYEIMFNVHMERKPWNTAATAIAIGELIVKYPNLTEKQLAKKLHVKTSRIREAMQFLRAPKELQMRAYIGELKEYHLILLIRSLESCENVFPELFTKKTFEDTIISCIEKVDMGLIRNPREFLDISTSLSLCKQYNLNDFFLGYFKKMVDDKWYTPKELLRDVYMKISFLENKLEFNIKDYVDKKTQNDLKKILEENYLKILDQCNEILNILENISNNIYIKYEDVDNSKIKEILDIAKSRLEKIISEI